jgi:4a-hydroxytetrahydrobiopterin dehydratase
VTGALTDTELEQALAGLSGWRLDDGALRRDVRFPDFTRAFAFLTGVALLAERQGHHPEIRNVYRDVTLRLRTHDAGGRVTQRDVDLAAAIDGLAPPE